MAIPSVIFATCPGCGVALELTTVGWQIGLAESEEGHGIVLEIAAFGGHVCWAAQG